MNSNFDGRNFDQDNRNSSIVTDLRSQSYKQSQMQMRSTAKNLPKNSDQAQEIYFKTFLADRIQ